jgi:membrane-bound lytic murein transglycosylase D
MRRLLISLLLSIPLAGPSTALFAQVEPPNVVKSRVADDSSVAMPTPVPTLAVAAAPTAAPNAETDLWQRVRRGFVMQELNSPLVQAQELWYANRPDYINRFVERGSRYMFHIVEEVEKRGLPTEIVLLPIIESAFNPQAYSRANAAGMWQFIPSTGKDFGLKQDWMTDNRRDILLSTNAALDYLTKLYGMFNSWELAFAAYNCGEGCVARAVAYNEKRGLPTDFASLRLPNETKSYVPKLIAVKNIVLSPASYGIDLPAVENRPFFTMVPAPEKIDVSLAAKLAEMDQEAFSQLNPSFSKPVASSGTGYFLVPIEHADVFKFNLDLYRTLNAPMVSWTTVSAKRGETVDAVARRHGMTAAYLRATNGPFKERKGKFTAPATFMAPNPKDANAIRTAFEQKVILKRDQLYGAVMDGDDGPLIKGPTKSDPVQFAGLGRVAKLETEAPAPLALAATAAPTPVLAISAATGTPASAVSQPMTPLETAAPTAPSSGRNETWTTYRVARGDTLFSIAKRAGLPLNQIKAENQLATNTVNIGQTLRIPSAAAANFSADAATVAESASPSVSKSAQTKQIVSYVVRTGDTLYAIARKFRTSVETLQSINRLKANAILKPGSRINVSG